MPLISTNAGGKISCWHEPGPVSQAAACWGASGRAGPGRGGHAASQRNLHPHGWSRFLLCFAVLVLEVVTRFSFFLNGKQEESVLFDVWN